MPANDIIWCNLFGRGMTFHQWGRTRHAVRLNLPAKYLSDRRGYLRRQGPVTLGQMDTVFFGRAKRRYHKKPRGTCPLCGQAIPTTDKMAMCHHACYQKYRQRGWRTGMDPADFPAPITTAEAEREPSWRSIRQWESQWERRIATWQH